jgi:hypothetical protein
VVMNGLERSNWADLYLAALVAVTALAVLVGIVVLLLIAKSPVPGAVIALAIAALAAGAWVSALVSPLDSIPSDVRNLVRWVPALIVGAALAWSGFRTVGRVIAGAVALLVLWIGPAVVTAVSAAAGTRVLATRPAEMLDYGIGVFNMALCERRGAERLRM